MFSAPCIVLYICKKNQDAHLFINDLIQLQASACHTDTTPTSHTETPTHIETRTHNQCGDTIEKSQAPDDGCINV